MNSETISPNKNYSVWGFTGTLIWSVVIALAFVITQILVHVIYVRVEYGKVPSSEYANLISKLQYNGIVLSISTFATLVICGAVILGVIKLKRNTSIKHYLGLNSVSLKKIKLWLLVVIGFIFVSDLFTILIGKPIVPEVMSSVYAATESPWLLLAVIIIGAPILEELIFRGFIIPGLSSSFLGPIGAILISSAAWAAIHLQYDLYGIVSIFLIGIMLGIARVKSNSVLLPIGLHSVINIVAAIETVIYVSYTTT